MQKKSMDTKLKQKKFQIIKNIVSYIYAQVHFIHMYLCLEIMQNGLDLVLFHCESMNLVWWSDLSPYFMQQKHLEIF